MLEFFIALFGGAYLLGRSAIDRINKHDYRMWADEHERRYREIKEKLTDKMLEYRYNDLLLDGKLTKDIVSKIEDDLIFIYGENWRKQFGISVTKDTPWLSDDDILINQEIALHLLMSKHGKIRSLNIHRGYGIGGIDTAPIHIRFGQRLEHNLQEAGVTWMRLVAEPPQWYTGDGIPYGGDMVWEYLLRDSNNTIRLW
jgi:hypothetical protein